MGFQKKQLLWITYCTHNGDRTICILMSIMARRRSISELWKKYILDRPSWFVWLTKNEDFVLWNTLSVTGVNILNLTYRWFSPKGTKHTLVKNVNTLWNALLKIVHLLKEMCDLKMDKYNCCKLSLPNKMSLAKYMHINYDCF